MIDPETASRAEEYRRIEKIVTMTDQDIRLICGEMTKQEMRTVKAVLAYIERRMREDRS